MIADRQPVKFEKKNTIKVYNFSAIPAALLRIETAAQKSEKQEWRCIFCKSSAQVI